MHTKNKNNKPPELGCCQLTSSFISLSFLFLKANVSIHMETNKNKQSTVGTVASSQVQMLKWEEKQMWLTGRICTCTNMLALIRGFEGKEKAQDIRNCWFIIQSGQEKPTKEATPLREAFQNKSHQKLKEWLRIPILIVDFYSTLFTVMFNTFHVCTLLCFCGWLYKMLCERIVALLPRFE